MLIPGGEEAGAEAFQTVTPILLSDVVCGVSPPATGCCAACPVDMFLPRIKKGGGRGVGVGRVGKKGGGRGVCGLLHERSPDCPHQLLPVGDASVGPTVRREPPPAGPGTLTRFFLGNVPPGVCRTLVWTPHSDFLPSPAHSYSSQRKGKVPFAPASIRPLR